jgi:uncharacterized protein YjiS (DUF1127 family)
MAFTDFAPADRNAAMSAGRVLRAVVAWFASRHAERARRIALHSLLEMGAHRLDDLGVTPQDVVDALNRPTKR